MKQIEIKNIEFGKKYVTAKKVKGQWSPASVSKAIDKFSHIVFKESGKQNTVSLEKLNVSKIGMSNSETIFALNYFNSMAEALEWCLFENRLNSL